MQFKKVVLVLHYAMICILAYAAVAALVSAAANNTNSWAFVVMISTTIVFVFERIVSPLLRWANKIVAGYFKQ